MFLRIAVVAVLATCFMCFVSLSKACDDPLTQTKTTTFAAKTFATPTTPIAMPVTRTALPRSSTDTFELTTEEEADFLANGPRLYTMDKALALSKVSGKPVVCWIGRHIFADERARKVSAELGETTIQAVMDTDGETLDRDGKRLPTNRVKFSSTNYKGASTAYIPVSKLTDSSGTKILKFIRGGSTQR